MGPRAPRRAAFWHADPKSSAVRWAGPPHDAPRDGEDSEEEELQEARGAVSKLREQLGGKDGSHESRPGRCVNKKKRKLQRAICGGRVDLEHSTVRSF